MCDCFDVLATLFATLWSSAPLFPLHSHGLDSLLPASPHRRRSQGDISVVRYGSVLWFMWGVGEHGQHWHACDPISPNVRNLEIGHAFSTSSHTYHCIGCVKLPWKLQRTPPYDRYQSLCHLLIHQTNRALVGHFGNSDSCYPLLSRLLYL